MPTKVKKVTASPKKKLSAFEIQEKVKREHLIPRQIEIDTLRNGLTPNDMPGAKYKEGSLKYKQTIKRVREIEKMQKKINEALTKKVKSMVR